MREGTLSGASHAELYD